MAKAAYIGGATLEEILANPDANPLSPEWMEDLAANPMSEAENGCLAAVCPSDMGNSATTPAPSIDPGRNPNGNGSIAGTGDAGSMGAGSSLIEGGMPDSDIAGLPSLSTGVAMVKGSLGSGTGGSTVYDGSFGFNLSLGSGQISNGRISGSGKDSLNNNFNFGLSNGSGSYSPGSFTIGNFTSGHVNGNAPDAGSWFSGTAPTVLTKWATRSPAILTSMIRAVARI